ncbi:MAG TPA: inositol monophosphatase family protein [Patescibacteria group bacterium]|nr:inositol monophosphatase family protein [Patescibacteria group bacterium]
MDFTLYKNFAEELALSAGKIIEEGRTNFRVVKQKDLQDVATTADIASEKYIIDKITQKYPDHSIFSEESPEIKNKSDFRWVIDPLDGTKLFVRGIPLYNISICLEFKGEPVTGVVYLPATRQLYSASLGKGAFLNEKQIKVSNQTSLKSSYIGFYIPTKNREVTDYEKGWTVMKKINEQCYRIRQDNSSNIALCFLAQGGIEAYINLTNPPHHHDLVTGLFIAKESGAVIKEFDNGTFLVANNKYIYSSLTDIIKI